MRAIAGYTIINVKSRDEVIEWTKRFSNPAMVGKDGEIEVRQFREVEDFEPSDAIDSISRDGDGSDKAGVMRACV